MTLGNVFESLKEAEILEVDSEPIVYLMVKTTSGEIRYQGLQFNLSVLSILLSLYKKSTTPLGGAFFYYDSHSRWSCDRICLNFITTRVRRAQTRLNFVHCRSFEPATSTLARPSTPNLLCLLKMSSATVRH